MTKLILVLEHLKPFLGVGILRELEDGELHVGSEVEVLKDVDGSLGPNEHCDACALGHYNTQVDLVHQWNVVFVGVHITVCVGFWALVFFCMFCRRDPLVEIEVQIDGEKRRCTKGLNSH